MAPRDGEADMGPRSWPEGGVAGKSEPAGQEGAGYKAGGE